GQIAQAQVFVGVAAVADYRPVEVAEHKLKKTESVPGDGGRTITRRPKKGRRAEVASWPAAPDCVGVAEESQNLDDYAEAKRLRKRVPLLIGNLVSDGLGTSDNCVTLYDETGRYPLPPMSKPILARRLVDELAARLNKQ
ncbi:MAG: phosphopantothenoylcysteine decarboxylase, partial [Fluviibacter sp.]